MPSILNKPTSLSSVFEALFAKLGKSTMTFTFVFVFALTGRISFSTFSETFPL